MARPAAGDARNNKGVALKECREQWDKLDGLLGRIYGAGWKTGKVPSRAADFASWDSQVFAPLSSRQSDLESKAQSNDSEKRSIKIDQDLLDMSISRYRGDVEVLQKEVSD